MKAKILLLVSLFFLSVTIPQAIAQGLTGRAYYKSSSQVKISMDSTKMAPEQMAEIQAQLKKQMERDYILSFTQTESTWKQAESLGGGPATASSGGMTMVINTGSQDKVLYKNLADQSYLREEEVMGKEFLIKDTLEPSEWELTGETKKIGNYTAQKATYSRIVDSQRFSTGMTEMENVKDTIRVTAWFTPEIPVSHGPDNFFGLPGLILEVQNQGRILICEKIELNPSTNPVKIEQPKKGKVVNREEFRAMQEAGMKQMMNQYQGKPGEGNQFTIRVGN
ncbi:GLPGLI family protein [Algoriphagus sp.]|jgi:GLPGLI family protein|uniref:GLPGLI family protein n=1 Tax=Algoriphagus sp. TaxID=1872435 RepID=UPI002724216F|nr:GLPGLI family protein [Algoriphagus sp.]MDO8968204.1 GLPGLI family protein [Algoriphagus sp.]MDP3198697.1 GLPGLI family protein [Algoriphagus sp.]